MKPIRDSRISCMNQNIKAQPLKEGLLKEKKNSSMLLNIEKVTVRGRRHITRSRNSCIAPKNSGGHGGRRARSENRSLLSAGRCRGDIVLCLADPPADAGSKSTDLRKPLAVATSFAKMVLKNKSGQNSNEEQKKLSRNYNNYFATNVLRRTNEECSGKTNQSCRRTQQCAPRRTDGCSSVYVTRREI